MFKKVAILILIGSVTTAVLVVAALFIPSPWIQQKLIVSRKSIYLSVHAQNLSGVTLAREVARNEKVPEYLIEQGELFLAIQRIDYAPLISMVSYSEWDYSRKQKLLNDEQARSLLPNTAEENLGIKWFTELRARRAGSR